VVAPRVEVAPALRARAQLRAVAALAPGASHVGRRAEVDLQAPELREGARAAGVGAVELRRAGGRAAGRAGERRAAAGRARRRPRRPRSLCRDRFP
jgi:hypothetical protein